MVGRVGREGEGGPRQEAGSGKGTVRGIIIKLEQKKSTRREKKKGRKHGKGGTARDGGACACKKSVVSYCGGMCVGKKKDVPSLDGYRSTYVVKSTSSFSYVSRFFFRGLFFFFFPFQFFILRALRFALEQPLGGGATQILL